MTKMFQWNKNHLLRETQEAGILTFVTPEVVGGNWIRMAQEIQLWKKNAALSYFNAFGVNDQMDGGFIADGFGDCPIIQPFGW